MYFLSQLGIRNNPSGNCAQENISKDIGYTYRNLNNCHQLLCRQELDNKVSTESPTKDHYYDSRDTHIDLFTD